VGVWGSGGINPHYLKLLTVKVSGQVHAAFPIPTLTYGVRCRLSTIIDLGRFREEKSVSLAGNTAPSLWSSISYLNHYIDWTVVAPSEALWLSTMPWRITREWMNRGTVPWVLNFNSRYLWMVTLTLCPTYVLVKSLTHNTGGWVVPVMWWW
jgi:hypothetical protein